ncbi:nucleotide exchange factor GrpE, partial [Patescibacteria group bacterium]
MKKDDKKNVDENVTEVVDDVVFEEEIEEGIGTSFGKDSSRKEDRLKKCIQEKQEYLDGWQRAKADLVNSKKEFEEQRKDFVKFAKADMINQVLPVVDSFDMAFVNVDGVPDGWLAGVKHIYNQFLSVLGDNGVKQIDPKGEDFDLKNQISVESVMVDDRDSDGKILEVVQKGYELNGRVIREAKVKVGEFGEDKRLEKENAELKKLKNQSL